VKGRRRRDQDGQSDEVRDSHADQRVEMYLVQRAFGLFRRPSQDPPRQDGLDVFGFLRGLPEEQVGTDGSASTATTVVRYSSSSRTDGTTKLLSPAASRQAGTRRLTVDAEGSEPDRRFCARVIAGKEFSN
jgi:hypothetical protein